MRRLTVSLLVVALVAAFAASAQATQRSQRPAAPQALYYSSYGHPSPLPPPASTEPISATDGPSWTAAILVGTALVLAFGAAGIVAGRASVRPKVTA